MRLLLKDRRSVSIFASTAPEEAVSKSGLEESFVSEATCTQSFQRLADPVLVVYCAANAC
jgi:hypothetical protein